MTTLALKEEIVEIASTGAAGRYFVVTKRHVYEYEGSEQKKAYDLGSAPRSKLHLGINGWGLVCADDVRTPGATLRHGLRFRDAESVEFVDEHTVRCSETLPAAGPVSVIGPSSDEPPILYRESGYCWQMRPYSKQLARTLRARPVDAKQGAPVLTVTGDVCGHLFPYDTFLGASPHGVLTCVGQDVVYVYGRSANGLESRLVTRLYGRAKRQALFGAVPDKDTYVVGWNEAHRGKWQVVRLVPFRKRAKNFCCFLTIILVTALVVCLVLGI